jgi:hypothetical protein
MRSLPCGYHLEPYGLDIFRKLAAIARTRVPLWRDRIFVGNAIDWDPPRRFVYVPQPRQPELAARLLNRVVTPGGRVIVCVYRAPGALDAEPIGELLRRWGFTVGLFNTLGCCRSHQVAR